MQPKKLFEAFRLPRAYLGTEHATRGSKYGFVASLTFSVVFRVKIPQSSKDSCPMDVAQSRETFSLTAKK
jgi:hypothetical protein